jgi:hypothetical protein
MFIPEKTSFGVLSLWGPYRVGASLKMWHALRIAYGHKLVLTASGQ